MAKHEQQRALRIYHICVAVLILLFGGALLGLGIWMKVTGTGGPFKLMYTGESFFNVVLSADIGAIILGCFLLLTGAISLIALARHCMGITFRIVYVLLATIVLGALIFTMVVSILIINKRDNGQVRDFISAAWQRTARQDPQTLCNIEKRFKCRGFGDSDCVVCKTGVEPECSTVSAFCAKCSVPSDGTTTDGCYPKIMNSIKGVFLPSAIVSGVLSAAVLIDIFTSWLL